MKIEYTKALNLASYSDSMQVVAYDDVTNRLLVSWRSNPNKIYSYFGLPDAYANIVRRVHDGESPRAVIKETTDSLQRETVFENAEFSARPQKLPVMPSVPKMKDEPVRTEFEVTVRVDGIYTVKFSAEDLLSAADSVKQLFSQDLDGSVTVEAVKKA